MIKSITQSSTLPLLKQIARFNERRQQVLSGNIARIDTPNYKSRDLPVEQFQAALANAAGRLTEPPLPYPNQYTSSLFPLQFPPVLQAGSSGKPGTVDELFTDTLFQSQALPESSLGLQDNGKRNVEYEMVEMTRTLMEQSYAMQLMNSQYNLLQSVISERP